MKKKKAKIIPKKFKPRSRRRKALERYFYLLLLSFSKRYDKKLAATHRRHAVELLRSIFTQIAALKVMVLDYSCKIPKQRPAGFRITRKIQRRPRRW